MEKPKSCYENSFTNFILESSFQLFFLFIFLTLFFYFYVVKIEESQFGNQVDLITDTIFTDWAEGVPKSNSVYIKDLKKAGNSILDALQTSVDKSFEESIKDVNENNEKIESKSKNLIMMVVGIFITALIMIFLMKVCIPLKTSLTKSIILTFFIALTEVFFLNIITKNYSSANPSGVEKAVGEAILNHK